MGKDEEGGVAEMRASSEGERAPSTMCWASTKHAVAMMFEGKRTHSGVRYLFWERVVKYLPTTKRTGRGVGEGLTNHGQCSKRNLENYLCKPQTSSPILHVDSP